MISNGSVIFLTSAGFGFVFETRACVAQASLTQLTEYKFCVPFPSFLRERFVVLKMFLEDFNKISIWMNCLYSHDLVLFYRIELSYLWSTLSSPGWVSAVSLWHICGPITAFSFNLSFTDRLHNYLESISRCHVSTNYDYHLLNITIFHM